MQIDSRFVQKTPVSVEIDLTDGSTIFGMVFTPPKGRLTDLLNDDRNFLPVESCEGSVLAIAKTAIKRVALPTTGAPVYKGNDPYGILGVSDTDSEETLKAAYRQLCLNNHPDRIRGLGLGSDFVELASNNMARINNAYSHISRALKKAGKDGNSAQRDPAAKSATASRKSA